MSDRLRARTRLLSGVLAGTAVLVAAALPAQQAASARSSRSTPLERGLAAIQTDRILADVQFVACDDTAGRDTPSVGQRLTARFIRNRLERLGWKPGAKEGWFQTYALKRRVVDEAGCAASATRGDGKVEFAFARDYSFSPQDVETYDLDAEVVYLGKVAEGSLEKAGAALKGRWALSTDPKASLTDLMVGLRKAGAVGVLSTIHVVNLGGDPSGGLVFRLWTDLMRAGQPSRPSKEPVFPRVYLPDRSIDQLLALAGGGEPESGQALPIRFAETRRMKSDVTLDCENVVGFWPGSDPEISKQVVIVSAHYDHLGLGSDGRIYNGADDNASGTCGLLALAEALAAHGPLACSVLLIWVSGEERGLWGSQAFVEDPWFPLDGKPVLDLNLDMIGREAGHRILVTPFDETHPAYNGAARLAKEMAREEGFTDIGSNDGYYARSDHANFAKLGIPIAFLSNGPHADYHEPTDDPEKIDGDKIRRVARTVFRMLAALQENPRERAK
jgi:peptidase M28-like protein